LPDQPRTLRNAWTGERLPAASRISGTLRPHASMVFLLER
jgi:hypothetical protein